MNPEYTKELNNGYLTDNKIAKIKFIDGFPQMLAEEFNKATPSLSTKQSRSIFDLVNKLNNRVARKDITLEEIKVELGMIKSMINDKMNKGNIPKVFFDFFAANVDAIKSLDDFKVFKLHFEAICNYLKDNKPAAPNGGGFNRNNFGSNQNRSGNGQNKPWNNNRR